MKRHKTIVPLSHDHYSGLLMAQAIKKNFIKTPLGLSSIDDKIKYVLNAYNTELVPHFIHEETILFPLATGRDADLDTLINEILEEHDNMHNAVKKIKDGDLEENLDKFGFMLEAHIRKEERVLFPKIEEILGDELNILDGQIIAVSDSCGI
jgi:iron-sulfur cluster repair protein YtfE (RIC family)